MVDVKEDINSSVVIGSDKRILDGHIEKDVALKFDRIQAQLVQLSDGLTSHGEIACGRENGFAAKRVVLQPWHIAYAKDVSPRRLSQ